MALVYCPSCSKQVDDKNQFCHYCGSDLQKASSIYDDDFSSSKTEPTSMSQEDKEYCSNCGEAMSIQAHSCPSCGASKTEGSYQEMDAFGEPIKRRVRTAGEPNNLGTFGFILALVSLMLPIMYLDIAIGVVAIILSALGMRRNTKRGLAIAGLIIGVLAVVGAITLLVQGDLDAYLLEPIKALF